MKDIQAIILLHEGFEELEAVASIDLLARAKVKVCLASMTNEKIVRGRSNIALQADRLFEAIGSNETYDAVILPGGPGINRLRKHEALCGFLKSHKEAGKIVACICAAPLLLLDSGILPQCYTAHPGTRAELPDARSDKCAWDGNILTSQGAGTATEFGLALVEALTDSEKRTQIADSICCS